MRWLLILGMALSLGCASEFGLIQYQAGDSTTVTAYEASDTEPASTVTETIAGGFSLMSFGADTGEWGFCFDELSVFGVSWESFGLGSLVCENEEE